MTSYGYSTLKDETWLPPQLGGHGDVATAWNGWPYSVISDSVKRYYLLELSYHAHSLVFHVITVKRNDFVEMTLHHTCAVLLVIFSYFANWSVAPIPHTSCCSCSPLLASLHACQHLLCTPVSTMTTRTQLAASAFRSLR